MEKLRIAMVTSEAVPFAKTGGLADVTGTLSRVLAEMGEEVILILPKYPWIEKEFPLEMVKKDLVIMGGRKEKLVIKKTYLPETRVPVYFIENNKYFDREQLYGDNFGDYSDNGERFAFFSRAAIHLLKLLNLPRDILHSHDWQTALIPVYLKALYGKDPFFKKTAIILTLHNLSYQGIFSREILSVIGLGQEIFNIEGLEFWGKVNYLKGGIIFADLLSTVSKTYCQEIQSQNEYGQGLEGILRNRKDSLRGILNGVDYREWNPAADQFIPVKYQRNTLERKKEVKRALQRDQNLPQREVPILSIVSRLDPQKGFELLMEVAEEILKLDLQLIVLGMGGKVYQALFQSLAKDYPDKVRLNFRFDNPLAHLIYGGSDFFLMPSRFEPCGLAQLISLRYGTIPIVRKTGGLADTVMEFNPVTGEGNGFLFERFLGKELLTAFRRAWDIYQNPILRRQIQENAMQADFSWRSSVSEYQKLYREAFNKKVTRK